MQHTLKNSFTITDIGLHSGKDVTINAMPAMPDHGIVFKRVDMDHLTDSDQIVPARWDYVVDTRLCTVIANKSGATVGTIEHLMAALRACGIDNALIEINAGEVPVLDGSSIRFIEEIEKAGIQEQGQPRRAIRVLKDVNVTEGNKSVTLSPSAIPVYEGQIDYSNTPAIGVQDFSLKLLNGNFKHDVADCRTFGLLEDVEKMKAAGLALGGSMENAVVVDDDRVLNPEGLRCRDEFIRHKILDAVGDIALADGLVLGKYSSLRGGHAMNNKILHELFSDSGNYEIVDLYLDIAEADMDIYSQEVMQAQASAL